MSERKVSTDALENLGTILDDRQKRDAIHLAVQPVQAGEVLRAGQWIAMRDGKAYANENGIAIVDPFIREIINPGDWFYLILGPRLVHSLRHVWSHPDFPDTELPDTKQDASEGFIGTNDFETQLKHAAAEQVLRDVAANLGVCFEELISRAGEWVEDREYWTGGAEFEGLSFNAERFWAAYDTYTDNRTPAHLRESFFSCSC